MERDPSPAKHSDPDVLAADVTRTPAGLRVETSDGGVYTFHRDDEDGKGVWIADVEPPSEIVAILNYEGYRIEA